MSNNYVRTKRLSNYYSNPYENDYKAWLLGGIVLTIVFTAFFAVGIFLLTRQIQASQYVALDAVVVDHKVVYVTETSEFSHTPEPNYFDVVEYEVDGETYRKTCDTVVSINTPPDDLGKVITIYVNPKNPKDVVFSNSTHILLTVLCLIVPIGGFIGTAFIYRKAYKIKKDD